MNDQDNRTIYDLVRNALQVQDACNLSGVVRSFAQDISRLRTLTDKQPGFSTDKLNHHPVCVMYSSKIASLTRSEVGSQFSRAYTWCQEMGSQADKDYPELPLPQ